MSVLVVVFPRGQLSADDKMALNDADVIAVEADDPKTVTQLHLSAPLACTMVSGDAIVTAALGAIANAPEADRTEAARTALRFVKLLSQSIADKAAGSDA